MKLSKKKLNEIHKFVSNMIEKKQNEELYQLHVEHNKQLDELNKKQKEIAVKLAIKILKENPGSVGFSRTWNEKYYLHINLPDDVNEKFSEERKKINQWRAEKGQEVNKKYNELRDKLEKWYIRTLTNIVFEKEIDIPDWMRELIELEGDE